MELFLKRLALTLDEWAAENRAIITERNSVVAVGKLSAADASTLLGMVNDGTRTPVIEDGTESVVGPEDIAEDFGPFKISFSKPAVPLNFGSVLTNTALADWLKWSPDRNVLWIARLETAFETYHVRFAPWGDRTDFTPAPDHRVDELLLLSHLNLYESFEFLAACFSSCGRAEVAE